MLPSLSSSLSLPTGSAMDRRHPGACGGASGVWFGQERLVQRCPL